VDCAFLTVDCNGQIALVVRVPPVPERSRSEAKLHPVAKDLLEEEEDEGDQLLG